MSRRLLPLATFLLPAAAIAYYPVVQHGDLLFFEYNGAGVVYNLEAESIEASFTPLGADSLGYIIEDGNLYAQSDLGIHEYLPPAYAQTLLLPTDTHIAGFGFASEKLWVGYSDGRIVGYEKGTLAALVEHSLPAPISDLVVAPTGDLFLVSQGQIQKWIVSPSGGFEMTAVTQAPFEWLDLEGINNEFVRSSGYLYSSADLSFVVRTEDTVIPTEPGAVIANSACGYIEHNLAGGPPKLYSSQSRDSRPDYSVIEDGHVVELDFNQILNTDGYKPPRVPLTPVSNGEPFLLEQPLALGDFTYHSFSTDGQAHLYFHGPDAAGRATVTVWSVAEGQPVVSAAFPCGIHNATYSPQEDKYYVRDTWGRIYSLGIHPEPALTYLNTFTTPNRPDLVATETTLEIQENRHATAFDFTGRFLEIGQATLPPYCPSPVPSHNRYACDRFAELEHIPDSFRAVADWVGGQLITLSSDYQLRFWSDNGEASAQYNAPFDHMLTVGDNIVLMRATLDGSEIIAVNPLAMPDADGDGIDDLADNCLDTANPNQADLDQDGRGDSCDNDSDGDLIPDEIERGLGLNPRDINDGSADPDADGFTNLQEYALGSNPNVLTSVPVYDHSYSEDFESGLPLRFFSQGPGRWSLTEAGSFGKGYRSADGTESDASSTMFFYTYNQFSQAVNFRLNGSLLYQVTVNDQIPQGLATSIESSGEMVGFRLEPGVNRIEVQAQGSLSPPRTDIAVPLFRYITVDDITMGRDRDSDAVPDSLDLCPLIPFEIGRVVDQDGDRMGHLCDTDDSHFDEQIDSDGDGYADFADSCVDVVDATQLDSDGDLAGNVCDLDDDNDSHSDELEQLHGSSTVEADQSLSLTDYFPVYAGVYRYKNPAGRVTTETIEHLRSGEFRMTDNDGLFTVYSADAQGLHLLSFGEKGLTLDLDELLYLPALWQTGDDYIHSAQAPSLSLSHEIALLDFHIVEFQGKPYAAATFRATQLFEGEQTVTEETYLKGIGLYRTDEFILESVEGRAIRSGNSPAQKKKKGGALGWEWLLLALLIAPSRLRARRNIEAEVR